MKLKKRMRVRCSIQGKEGEAKIQEKDGELYLCQNFKGGEIVEGEVV